jgi:hypothetical protein
MAMPRFSRSHVLVALAAVVGAWALPAAAREVVDYAKNAGAVDGFSAVGYSSDDRDQKLVATNRNGHLPNDIIKKAPEAQRSDYLRQFGPSAFVQRCQAGSLRGQAYVSPTIGTEMEKVPGFGTLYGGPVSLDGHVCHGRDAKARKVSVGVYDVDVAEVGWQCDQPFDGIFLLSAVVTVESAEPLVSTYEPFCESGSVYTRVHIFDVDGTAQDAPFSVALLKAQGIPIP